MFESFLKPTITTPTVSGSVCTFNTQYALPLKSHTVNIDSVSGVSAINIHHASKNLLLITASSTTVNVAYTINNDGTVDVNGSNTSQTVYKLGEFKAPKNMTIKYGGITGGSSTTYSVNLRVNGSYKGDIYEGYSNAISLNEGDVAEFLSVVRANYAIDTTLTPMIIDGNETNYTFVKGDVLHTIQIGSTVNEGVYNARTGVMEVTQPSVQTIQLPPCPIDTLVGVNNIWADTGDTTLQYIKLG